MAFESFVALRYLTARRKQAFISVISVISILGVALGVASLIVAMGIMNGFSRDLQDKILGVNSHAIVMHVGGMPNYAQALNVVKGVSGVTGVTPFIYSEGMASSPRSVKGVVFRGIDPDLAPKVLAISKYMKHGSLAALKAEGLPGVVIGQELSKQLGVGVGNRISLMSPAGKKTAAGFTPRIRLFRIVGIFKTGMWEYDSSLVFISLAGIRDLTSFASDKVTGLEVAVNDVYRADAIGRDVADTLNGYPYYVRNWMEMNANLFAALKLEKTAMGIVLALIILVGTFSIVTSLVMLVMEKTRDIAIMMSMGATQVQIRRIFMFQGAVIGTVGTLLGFALGLTVSFLLKRYQFIDLPKGVYPFDKLPVILESSDLIIIGISSLLLCFVATIYPARQAASLEPAEALRYE